MRRHLKRLNQFKRSRLQESGQAIVEYMLMLLVAISVVAMIATGFRKMVVQVWGFYIKQISAACPGCPVDPRYKFR